MVEIGIAFLVFALLVAIDFSPVIAAAIVGGVAIVIGLWAGPPAWFKRD